VTVNVKGTLGGAFVSDPLRAIVDVAPDVTDWAGTGSTVGAVAALTFTVAVTLLVPQAFDTVNGSTSTLAVEVTGAV
jgi:hypothetical protein